MTDAAAKDKSTQGHKDAETVFVVDAHFAFADLGELTGRLRKVTRSAAPKDMGAIEVRQTRYCLAVLAVARFVKDSGIGDDVANELVSLAQAIGDLQDGIQSPYLKAAQRNKGRVPDQTEVWQARVDAVLGLEGLIASGIEPREAAKHAAAKYRGLKNLCRGENRKLGASLTSWRDVLNQKWVKNAAAQANYDDHIGVVRLQCVQLSRLDCKRLGYKLLAGAEVRAKKLAGRQGANRLLR
jgi:hypothetical protein